MSEDIFNLADKTNNAMLLRYEYLSKLEINGTATHDHVAELDAIDAEFKRRDS